MGSRQEAEQRMKEETTSLDGRFVCHDLGPASCEEAHEFISGKRLNSGGEACDGGILGCASESRVRDWRPNAGCELSHTSQLISRILNEFKSFLDSKFLVVLDPVSVARLCDALRHSAVLRPSSRH